eukprot:2848021-Pyramimonas_sp.AAC.2
MLLRVAPLVPEEIRAQEIRKLRILLHKYIDVFKVMYQYYSALWEMPDIPHAYKSFMMQWHLWAAVKDCFLTTKGFSLAAINRLMKPVYDPQV